MKKLDLQRIEIKVPENWKVEYNSMTSLDPEDKDLTKEELEANIFCILTQDLLQIRSKFHFIDAGWYPDSDVDGEFRLVVLLLGEDNYPVWDKPIYELKTRSLQKLLLGIEIITSIMDIENFNKII